MTSLEDILIKFAAKVQAIDDTNEAGQVRTLKILSAIYETMNKINEQEEELEKEAKRQTLSF